MSTLIPTPISVNTASPSSVVSTPCHELKSIYRTLTSASIRNWTVAPGRLFRADNDQQTEDQHTCSACSSDGLADWRGGKTAGDSGRATRACASRRARVHPEPSCLRLDFHRIRFDIDPPDPLVARTHRAFQTTHAAVVSSAERSGPFPGPGPAALCWTF